MTITIASDLADDIRDEFREECLQEMDAVVRRLAGRHGFVTISSTPAATDADLPALFRVLDAQLARALARCGVELED